MEFRITMEGTGALLTHNAQLSNPLSKASKALKPYTSKRKKTDDDHEAIARLEFIGGLYLDDIAGPYIPGDNVWRCLYDAAKKSARGPKIKEGLLITTDVNPLGGYGKPRKPGGGFGDPGNAEALWADENFRHYASAKVGQVRVTRCRPIFRTWKVEADGNLDTDVLNFSDLEQVAQTAGLLIGLGDWRPKFGRFTATVKQT